MIVDRRIDRLEPKKDIQYLIEQLINLPYLKF